MMRRTVISERFELMDKRCDSIARDPPTIDTRPNLLGVAPDWARMSSLALESRRMPFEDAAPMLESSGEMFEPS